MIIISHDRHFLNERVHPHGRHGLRHIEGLSGQLRRLHVCVARRRARNNCRTMPRPRTRSPSCKTSCAASRPINRRRDKPLRAPSKSTRSRSRISSRPAASIRSSASNTTSATSCIATRWKCRSMAKAYDRSRFQELQLHASKRARRSPSSAPTASVRPRCCAAWRATCSSRRRHDQMGGESQLGYYAQDHAADFAEDKNMTDWMSRLDAGRRRRRPGWCAARWAVCCSPAMT